MKKLKHHCNALDSPYCLTMPRRIYSEDYQFSKYDLYVKQVMEDLKRIQNTGLLQILLIKYCHMHMKMEREREERKDSDGRGKSTDISNFFSNCHAQYHMSIAQQ